MGFASKYERYLMLTIVDGRLTGERMLAGAAPPRLLQRLARLVRGGSSAAVDADSPHPDNPARVLRAKHLLQIEGLHPPEIGHLLDLAESYVLLNRSGKTQRDLLRGRTLINLFFEDSTRTRTSFELAGKRLGADVINMSVSTSSVNKGETLLDTAATLNAMQCDLLVVRHAQSGAPQPAGGESRRRRDQRRRRHA